jgi:hypothetical protein
MFRCGLFRSNLALDMWRLRAGWSGKWGGRDW